MVSKDWLEANSAYPLIQVLMPPVVLKALEEELLKEGFQLVATDLGEGGLPTLALIPGGELLGSLMKLDVDGHPIEEDARPEHPDARAVAPATEGRLDPEELGGAS